MLGRRYHPRVPETTLIDRYAAHLPVTARTPRLTLGEGDTPLLRAHWLEHECGIDEVWLKVEGANPTGSFKDGGMVLAVAKAIEEGARALLCASTGNTSASAAAYAARAGLACTVVLPAGYVAAGKLVQAIAFGARIVAVRGAFDAALAVVRELGESGEATIRYSFHPRCGAAIIAVGCTRHGDEAALIIRQPDGTLAQLPIWMTEDRAAEMGTKELARFLQANRRVTASGPF